MKKVILALAIAASAVYAQAAAVKWDSGTVKDMSGTNIGNKTATAGWVATVTFWDETGKDVIATTGLSDNTSSMSKFNATTGSDFAAQNVEFESMQSCSSAKLWDFIVFDEEDVEKNA